MKSLHLALLACAALFGTHTEAGPGPKTRIILVGDSTVAPRGGWGDEFAKRLAPGAECRNLALGGRSSKSYRGEGHWEKVLEARPDWVLIQFGHNDQPGKGPKRETDADTSFRENLVNYIADLKKIGARPVLVTSLTRRNFNPQGRIDAERLEPYADAQVGGTGKDHLADYVAATRAVAAAEKVPLVDLNARSVGQMNEIGPEAAAAYDLKKGDTTHLSPLGAQRTALLVATEIQSHIPELASLLKK
ncbi:rhamnogalacturonan acetylesterase [Luteolibacter yonseiensis]|uniref:Rhamnogalacturonan acetylesterase n=1 Tax=Luteolibacter yonseiensis TaxID=1144680 RepID=A0A934R4C7_9BACT|nr:rhamnogalacturonan acetylesterase [Luteolibacter yonseiensis]MBK1814954.1 rhamnogalacturonan acetylesterase [Luteolibacter yonseiensis]